MTLPRPTRRRLHRLRLGLEAFVAFVVILGALVVGSAGLLLPWAVKHPERVRAFLEARLGRPVAFARVEGDWRPVGPVFTLHDVALGAGTPFAIERAELAIDFYAWLKPDVAFSEFRIVGVAVDVVREPSGEWHVAQVGDVGQGGGARLDTLGLGSFSLRDARLSVTDLASGATLRFAKFDARLADEGDGRRLGGTLYAERGAPPIRFACALAEAATGRCYVEGAGLELARWFQAMPVGGITPLRGELDAKVWFDYAEGRLAGAQAELATRGVVLRGVAPIVFGDGDEIEPRHAPADFAGAARFERTGTGWRLDLVEDDAGDAGPNHFAIAAEGEGEARALRFAAPRLELGRVAPLLALSSRAPNALRSFAYENAPRGTLSQLVASWRGGLESLDARADAIAVAPSPKRPGFGALSGRVLGDRDAVVFLPDPGQRVTVDFPHMFRTPLVATLNRATLAASRSESGWRFEASEFDLDGEGYGATGSVALEFGGEGRPFADAAIALKPGTSVPSAKLFWPVNRMPRKAVAWLDRGLVSGVLLGGTAIVRGDLDDWPFRGRGGRFEARAELGATTVLYHPDWPVARIEAADVAFIDEGMDVRLSAGETLGNSVTSATARIPDFKAAVLDLDVEGEGSGEDLLRLLRASPIGRKYAAQLIGLDVGGRGEVALGLDVVLDDDLPGHDEPPLVDGRVRLRDADLADAKYAIALQAANGTVRFGRDGFGADDIAARLDGEPVSFGIAVGDYTSDPARLAEASLRGELPIRSVLAELDALAPLHARMPGRSEWTLELAVPRDDAPKTLTLRSDLVGTALALPAPLAKPASQPLPTRVDVTLPMLGGRIDVALGHVAQARIQLPGPERELAADIAFGGDAPQPVPDTGLHLHGTVEALDLGGWGGFAGAGAGAVPVRADLSLGTLTVGGRDFDDVRLAFSQTASQHVAVLAGKSIAGRVILPRGDLSLGVSAEFERLWLPEAKEGTVQAALDPARLPAIHFWAKDMKLGAASFGEARIEAVPFPGGLRFDTLETRSPDIEMRARGEWTGTGAAERSRFEIDFTAESLGRMLEGLGYTGVIEGGQTYARLAGSWPGAPTRFSLAAVDGTLEAKIGKGRVPDVEPGAGRFFGLVSLQSLPRRLSLDFSDFFKSGLAFDSITGKFELRDGNAYTDDLVLQGPAAEIRIEGRTGLALRDYDQRLAVTPRVGGMLPVVGALAAGPVGAAAGLVASIIPQAGKAEYQVQGSWDKPEITLLAKSKRTERG